MRHVLGAVAGEIGAWVDEVLPLRGPRSAFRRWRRTRPFWGGVLVVAGGGLRLNLWLPVFTGRDVTAGQVAIEARTVRAANLRADVTRADD